MISIFINKHWLWKSLNSQHTKLFIPCWFQRNPNIKLYGLPWVFSGVVSQGKSDSPYTFPERTVDYILRWIKGARDVHNLTIDYIGVSDVANMTNTCLVGKFKLFLWFYYTYNNYLQIAWNSNFMPCHKMVTWIWCCSCLFICDYICLSVGLSKLPLEGALHSFFGSFLVCTCGAANFISTL